MRIVWISLLLACTSLVYADLPSCERARCIHCEVEFIARMCPRACGACSRTVIDVATGLRVKVLPDNNRLVQHAQQTAARSQLPAQPPQINPPVKRVNPTQPQANFNQPQAQTFQQLPNIQLPLQPPPALFGQPAAQFAAPQLVVPAIQYPTDTSTLAPLIAAPNAYQLNTNNLAQRPADLAQPFNSQQFQQTATSYYQQPAYNAFHPQQQFGGIQNPQQFNNGFNVPQPASQTFPTYNHQQASSSNSFNPFQPFLHQSYSAGNVQSALDPLNLFNFGGNNNYQLPQVNNNFGQQQQASSAQSQATSYHGQFQTNTPTQPAAGQQAQQSAVAQPQQQQYQQPAVQQQFQMPTAGGVPPSPLPPVNLHATAGFPQYQTNYQPQQPQQVQQQITAEKSIDSAPTNYQKPEYNSYVDPKASISVPVPPPAQCPRQPGWAPCITKELANQRFGNCCARLGEGCQALCNYDATLATMQLAVLTGRCPLNKVADMMICASGYEDATQCCEAYNVFEPGYEHCRPYCNPAAGLPQGGLLSEKYKCLVKLGAIQQCFYVSQKP